MNFKSTHLILFMFLALLSGIAQADTVAHWRFEGTLDANIVSVADEISGKIVTALPGTAVSPSVSLTYGQPAPFFGGNSSAFFYNPLPNEQGDTGICLMRPDDNQLDMAGATALTIEAFVKPAQISQSVVVRDYHPAKLKNGYWVDMTIAGDFNFKLGDGTTQLSISSGPNTVTLDEWQHVAGTWDGTTMRIYIDGVEMNSDAYSAGLVDNSGAFGIGAIVRHSGTGGASNEGQYFNGYIDEVRISDTALSPNQFLNYDTTPIIQFQLSDSQNAENITPSDLAVLISIATPNSVTVDYSVTSGTADGNGIDYTLAAGTLTFAPLQTTPEYIIIDVNDDDLPESEETIVVTLSNPVNAELRYNTEHTYTILDDDTIPTVEFESASSGGSEASTPAALTVNLSRPYKDTVSVYYAAVGGTADWGIDYILPNGLLAFDPYETSKDISVEIIDDDTPENYEDIQVVIFSPTNAVLGTNQQHWYTIYDAVINSVGMEFVSISAGGFQMGSTNGDWDEVPVHNVTISEPFYMSTYEVTNAQYEQFDPNHALVDHRGFTHGPNEAVIFVSWEDANAFCTWLSDQEGLPYRLPTEAEWEYACRAGTTTEYYTGSTCDADKNQVNTIGPNPQDLSIGNDTANAFGLYDMHGNVEEWCMDWYGPYDSNSRTDPLQLNDTSVKVSRGGSHSTPVYFLRSANRMGAVPQDNHWLIGFRIVLGELPAVEPLPEPPLTQFQSNVSQTIPPDINDGPDPDVPYLVGPKTYVKIPPELDGGPLYSNHNHVPGIVECPNGDLMTVWYSTIGESDRLLNVAASRLRYGQDEWEDASLFWNNPDRNDHAPQVWLDEDTGTLYHFNGLADAYSWSYLSTVMRTSTDNGVTWSKPRLIMPEHLYRHMPIESVFRASNGDIILPCDAVPGGAGGTAIWISFDDNLTWYDPGAGQPAPSFVDGGTGAWIAGIHAGVAEITGAKLLAFGRGDSINGMMPRSVSSDWGYNWTYSASQFPPIGGGKRLALIRLKEGPLFFASFGAEGLFCTVSYNDGLTWTQQKVLGDSGGYLSVHQGKNNIIHLITSRVHYQMNLKYLDQYHTGTIDYNDINDLSKDWLKSDSYTSSTAGTPPDANYLLLHYNFDETSGDIVHDWSGNFFDANIVGSTGWMSPSYDDSGCLSFNDDTAIAVPPAVTTTIDQQITISVWLYGYESAEDGGTRRDNVVFDTGAGDTYLRAIVPDIPLDVTFQAGDTNDVLTWADSNSTDWQDQWRHYAFVKNGSTLRIYRDGEMVAEKTDAAVSISGVQNQTFDIGTYIIHANDYKGKMDEFRIYDYPLSDDEILYLAKTATFYIPVDSDWDLYEDGIINFKDYSILTQLWNNSGE